MKKISSSKLLLAFSSIGLLIYSVIYACSDNGDWGWTFDSNFTPETFVDKSYLPLFLSSDFFYGIGYDREHNMRFNDEIVADWSAYLKGSISDKEVKFFLIDSSATDVINLYSYLNTKKSNATVDRWSKIIKLKDKKTRDFITFLYHAQALETVSINTDYWSYEPQNTVVYKDVKRVQNIEKKYYKVTDSFLKNRYWLLTIKAYFYSNNKPNADSFFQKTEDLVPKNTLYYRGLSYMAGLEHKNKNYAKSNYLFAQVFDQCPQLRIVATYSFHPQEQADWNASLAMTKNNDEKAALWAIRGYYADEERAIQEIYKLNPKNQHLDYLLSRLINKQENILDRSFKDQTVIQNKLGIKNRLNKNQIKLVFDIANSNTTAQPYLWNIAAGYLETLNGNFAQADKNFAQAEDKMPKTSLAINQLRLLRFVNNLSKIDKINVANEKTIVSDLNWLYFELPKEDIENFRYQKAASWSKSYLSALYKTDNNKVMSELFSRDNNFYNNQANLLAMKAFLTKSNNSVIENIASKNYDLNLNDINNYQAVKATFDNKITEAIVFMKQTDSLQYVVFYGNPFNGRIKDCHDCEHLEPQKKKYTQIEFLTTIKLMQDKIEKQEDIYENALLVGNAFYNITHFGNARLFYEGNIIGYGSSPFDYNGKTKTMITNCSWAKIYYQKAFEAAKNDEQKAKCQYLLAKCERNDYYNKKYYTVANWWEIENDKINFIAWNGFKHLKSNYSNTKYYRDVIAECGYFDTYVKQ